MSSDENDKSTERIFEYYQKYSQNRHLPKYFSGTSLSYLPPIVLEDDAQIAGPSIIHDDPILISEVVKISIAKAELVDESSAHSSLSESPSGHKKLEWDNGADIGYDSVRKGTEIIKKSSSLPILHKLKSIEQGNFNTEPITVPSTITTNSNSAEKVEVLVFSSSSSKHESPEDKISSLANSISPGSKNKQVCSRNTSPTSNDISKSEVMSSSSNNEKVEITESQKNLEFLKKKIGLPDAHSTPNSDPSLNDRGCRTSQSLFKNLVQSLASSQGTSMDSNCGRRIWQLHGEDVAVVDKKEHKLAKDTRLYKRKPTHKLPSLTRSQTPSPPPQPTPKDRSKGIKVVEVDLSTPININCTSFSPDENPQKIVSLTPRAVQTETVNYRHIETQFNFEGKCFDKASRRGKSNSSDALADSASSFEYISLRKGDIVNDRGLVQAKNQHAKSKTGISGVLKEISFMRTSTDSSPISKASSEDIDRHLEILHKLFKTKKFNSSTKKRYIKKLLKELNELNATCNNSESTSSSSDLFIPKKDSSRVNVQYKVKHEVAFKGAKELIPGKINYEGPAVESNPDVCDCRTSSPSINSGSIKMAAEHERRGADVRSDTDIKETINYDKPAPAPEIFTKNIASSNVDTLIAVKTHVGSISEDPLLRFAENERAYQLNWIKNEISHLSKLKNILELKDRDSQQSQPKSQLFPLFRTNTYNVAQKSNTSKAIKRNFVIETGLNLVPQSNINYLIDGKEYVVSDSQKTSSEGEKAIIADIKVSSDDNHTNIKVSTLCSMCRKVVCVCVAEKINESKSPSLTTDFANPEPCLRCNMTECICKNNSDLEASSATASSKSCVDRESAVKDRVSSLLSDLDIVSPEDYNSLQKIFKNCECTTKNPNCGCGFVRKLLDKFQVKLTKSVGINECVQTDILRYDQLVCEPKSVPLATASTNQSEHIYHEPENKTLRPKVKSEKFQVETNCQHQSLKIQCLSGGQPDGNGHETNAMKTTIDSTPVATTKQTLLGSAQIQVNEADRKFQTGVDVIETAVQTALERVCQCVQTDEIYFGDGTAKDSLKRSIKSTKFQAQGKPLMQSSGVLDDKVMSEEQKPIISRMVQTETIKPNLILKQDSTTASSETITNGSSRVTCYCCKQKAFLAEVSYLQEGDDSLVVCSRCYFSRPRYCSHNCKFMCRCWNYCQSRKQPLDGLGFCQCCGVEVSQCLRRLAGLKYTVILQEKESREGKNGRIFQSHRVKVRDGWSKKGVKDKENYDRKEGIDRTNSMRKEKRKKNDLEEEVNGVTNMNRNERNGVKNDVQYTLTEYLVKNKPGFVYSAEYRRQMLLNSRILRERKKDSLKIRFLENNFEQTTGVYR
ncbi:uncharacterized protein [Euwallacea fornicatus]|uniref:uncharacterized protein isoform X2 n=1 Tax=Euwallacea fornicatus TaxID=995702 RepID=UPI0033902A1B